MGQNWSDLVRFGNITLIGVLHYRVEFSVLVNTYVRNEKPDCICVELPNALRNEIISGVRRLPHHSVILYETAEKENAVLIMEGSDGVQEAARSALENNIPLWFIDPLPLRYPLFMDRIPDAYVIDKIGQKTFIETVLPRRKDPLREDEENAQRETFMTSRLQSAARDYGKVLFVGGLGAHTGDTGTTPSTPAPPVDENRCDGCTCSSSPSRLPEKRLYRNPQNHRGL